MPFFLPSELVEYEYLETGEVNELARQYSQEIDLAFFVVNFGYTKRDYLELTAREKAFIYKAWEDKLVRDSELESSAVQLAISNAARKKGQKPKRLWKPKPKNADNVEELQQLIQKSKNKNMHSILQKIKGERGNGKSNIKR